MSHQFNRIMNHSNPKNKKIMIKNMRGMNDPAFQSNNTLKEYINKKLTLYKGSDFNTNTRNKSLFKYTENNHKKIRSNRNYKTKNFVFTDHSFYSKTQIHNLTQQYNSSLNNLRKNKEIKEKKINNNFYVFRCNNINISNNNKIINKSKQRLKSNLEGKKINNYLDIILTPNNNNNYYKKEKGKTTPINALNKIKGIYRRKNMILNKSYKSYSRDYETVFKKEKEIKSPQNNNKTKLKNEISNIINQRPLNKTYVKENSKKFNNNLKNNNNEKLIDTNKDYFLSENNEDENNNDKYKDLLLKEESLNESECPEPMPYVKKYSDNINKENISNNEIYIINKINKNLNDLKEPKEEKNIPLPVSQNKYVNKIYGNYNKKFIYMNRNKFIKKNI